MSILLALVGGITASHQTTNVALNSGQVPGIKAHASAALAWHAEAVSTKRANPTLTGTVTPSMPPHWSIVFMSSCADSFGIASWISNGSVVRPSEIGSALRRAANPTDAVGKSNGIALITPHGTTHPLPCAVPAGQLAIYTQL
ncbi:MAG: hypothetical protein RJS97_04940 [Parvibaculaceae bacterium]